MSFHTPIDDLESFVWVLVWAVLAILEQEGLLGLMEEDYWRAFKDPKCSIVESRLNKWHLILYWVDPHSAKTGNAAWNAWRPLITKLWTLVQESASDVERLLEASAPSHSYHSLSKSYCEKYIDVLLDAMDDPAFARAWSEGFPCS